jgi:rubrerythrin
MTKTQDHLNAAFAGESQANRRYLAFAKQAQVEGYPQVAKLFRAAAAAETVHALSHLRTLGDVKTTAENLQVAISGENYEHVSMYPDFIAEAEAAGEKKALGSFHRAMEVEKEHEALYKAALENLGSDQGDLDYYICPFCGSTHYGKAPEKCPVCGTPGSKFERVS